MNHKSDYTQSPVLCQCFIQSFLIVFCRFMHLFSTHSQSKLLRIKIEDDTANPTYITTVWGLGYKWGA